MIESYRNKFNEEFSTEKYQKTLDLIKDEAGFIPHFRVSESPIFIDSNFKNKLISACDSIVEQIKRMFNQSLQKAIPDNCNVPNDEEHPHFLTIDFGICESENGEIEPQLIELQAFPTLYSFQKKLKNTLIEVYPFLNTTEQSLPTDEYIAALKSLIIGEEDPKNVILMEIFPEKQKTQIDFIFTEKFLGIKTVCLTKVIKKGKDLFYEENNELIHIRRIYNRVIFDELDRIPDLKLNFDVREEVNVKWITHPNWFFKISKYLLPQLKHQYIPKSYFLNDFPSEEKLENFVLKPLFSFAGAGVNLYPTQELIDSIEDPHNFIMQRKVNYAQIFKDPNNQFSKAEIRLLYIWPEDKPEPQLMEYLVRMTKAEMVNVDFNKKDAIWIGGTTAFFV